MLVICFRFLNTINENDTGAEVKVEELTLLPVYWKSILPVIVPVLLVAAGSAAELLPMPALMKNVLLFFGSPVVALLTGLLFSLLLVKRKERNIFNQWMVVAIRHAGPILILVGAGGVFGHVLKKTPLAALVQQWVSNGSFSPIAFLMIAYAIGCLLKTAQGSTTSAIIVATSILSPIAFIAGFKEPLQLSLLLSATAAGAMMVSHANDAYFWVIAQFTGLSM